MTRRIERLAMRTGVIARLRHPKTTVRWRLTLLYGGLFLVCGAALLAVTYTLVDHATMNNGPFRAFGRPVTRVKAPTGPGGGGPRVQQRAEGGPNRPPFSGSVTAQKAGEVPGDLPPQLQTLVTSKDGRIALAAAGSFQRVSDLHQLVIESSIALAVMAIISAALGWVVAGRVLRPLRTITDTAQQISAANLHERLALRGPRDELRRLADTIDELLGRLERAFDAQRRFVANASHELRTPLTAARALLEMVMTDPHATVETFRDTCGQVLQESEQQEQLIDALLALAQGQRGTDNPKPLDLAAIAGAAVRQHETEAAVRAVRLEASLDPAPISGERRLIERLVGNLIENALRHNLADGSVQVRTDARLDRATLTVSNTGPVVPPEEIDRLLQPFQRLSTDRVGQGGGLGLGLSIVAAISDAHGADLEVNPRAGGGLDVNVRFPPGSDYAVSEVTTDSPGAVEIVG